MAIKTTVNVTKIEVCPGKKGTYKKIHYTDAKGPHKLAVFDAAKAAVFTGNGSYAIEIDKPEGSEYWQLLTASALSAAAPESNGAGSFGRSRSIEAQCAIKASAQVLASYAASGMEPQTLKALIPGLMSAFLHALDNLTQPNRGEDPEVIEGEGQVQ